ncbi:MAG: YfhO family protein [Deltaproteobacteria bacterium]|nr:YfhO family protein [Deltaproteobacteria bacterium]
MQKQTPTYLVVTLTLFLCIITLFGVLIPSATKPFSEANSRVGFDFFGYFLPKYAYGTEELLRGDLPLWNRFEYGGIPFLATAQPAVLYPPKIIAFALLAPESAYYIYLLLHYCGMALFFLLFVRDQGVSAVGAMSGGAFWTFAHLVLSSNYHPVRIANLIWIPLIFLLVERSIRKPSAGVWVGLAVAVALQLTAGYPEVGFDLSILMTLYAVAQWLLGNWKSPPWRSVPVLAAMFILGGLLASFQVVPLVELALTSKRVDFIELGNSLSAEIFLNSTLSGLLYPFPSLLVFVVIGIVHRKSRPAAGGLLFCFIMFTGGWLLVRKLPGLENIRFPYVWLYMTLFFLAWLAALGTDALIRDLRVSKKAGVIFSRTQSHGLSLGRARWIVGIGASLWIALCAVPLYALISDKKKLIPQGTSFNLVYLTGRTELAVGIGLAAAILLLVLVCARIPERLQRWGVFVTLVIITLGQTVDYPRFMEAFPMRQPQVRSTVVMMSGNAKRIKGRTFSLFDVRHGYAMTERIESLLGSEISFLPWRFRLVFVNLGMDSFYDFSNWKRFVSAKGFLDAMNLQSIIAPIRYSETLISSGLQMVRYRPWIDALFENPDRMGHAWINYGATIVDSPEKALVYVFSSKFNPRREVVLEQLPRNKYSEHNPPEAEPVRDIRRRSATEVEYRVKLERPGLLVVSESGYPGWIAHVDGKPTRWLQANFLLRAVELTPGAHTVRFEYRPWWFSLASVLTAMGFLLLLAILLWSRLSSLARRIAQ